MSCARCVTPSNCRDRAECLLGTCDIYAPQTKESAMPAPNPKAARAVADGKAPLDYLEPACDEGEALVLFGGAIKYGRRNYRDTEMLWSTYLGSMRRHLLALARGEDNDPESGLNHLYHIRANTAVLLGAMEAGTLKDDRTTMFSTPRSDAVHIDGNQDAKDGRISVEPDRGGMGIPVDVLLEYPHGTQFVHSTKPFEVGQPVCCAGTPFVLDVGCAACPSNPANQGSK